MVTSLKTASVLAFERKLDTSDGLFFSGSWSERSNSNNWQPIKLREKSVRGTISNRLKTKDVDPAKLDADVQKPNLQTIDIASLLSSNDTLNLQFTLRVLPGIGVPSACNDSDYQTKLLKTVNEFMSSVGVNELARRYAYNLANGRFFWRNRIGAEQVEVRVTHLQSGESKKTFIFDSLTLSLRNFEVAGNHKSELDELTHLIAAGLKGEQSVLLGISAFARLGGGQEVFPSQELILDKGKTIKSRTLYAIDSIAAMHSQKISNAVRTIDTWYGDEAGHGPIAIEPYGSVTSLGKAFRQPGKKQDFYSLLDNWVLNDKEPSDENKNFVIAILIRGGVFGDGSKD